MPRMDQEEIKSSPISNVESSSWIEQSKVDIYLNREQKAE